MLETIGESTALAVLGFSGGLVLGLAARLGRFCTLGAIEDLHYGGSWTRMRMWGVALGTAILSVFLASTQSWVDPGASFYLGLAPNLLAAGVGGLVFGVGMALSGTCGYGALARLGGGEMRFFPIVLMLGLAAMATQSGPLAPLRVMLFDWRPATDGPTGIAHGLASVTGLSVAIIGIVIGVAFLIASLWRSGSRAVLWGVPVGLAIASGFVGTAWVSTHGFEPVDVMSHSFAAPVGDTMLFVMLSSGLSSGFGVGSVFGVLVGAFIGSTVRGVFRWEACDDYRELRRQIGGAALMGIGAVIALGCSVGQGLSALAVLAYGAPVTLGAIWLGAVIGLRLLIEGRLIGQSQA